MYKASKGVFAAVVGLTNIQGGGGRLSKAKTFNREYEGKPEFITGGGC